MNVRWSGTTLVWLLVAAIVCAACSSTTTSRRTSPIHVVSVPEGWRTYTYGKAAISVPSSWAVRDDTNCPDGKASGTLLLGYPKVLEYCPNLPASISYVAVTTFVSGPPGSPSPAQKPVKVNGVPVYVGFGSPGSLEWAVPSLGVQITGTGSDANRILHTLRVAETR